MFCVRSYSALNELWKVQFNGLWTNSPSMWSAQRPEVRHDAQQTNRFCAFFQRLFARFEAVNLAEVSLVNCVLNEAMG
jgi:hypothetical protein